MNHEMVRYWTRTSDPYNVRENQEIININNSKVLGEVKNPLSSSLSSISNDTICPNDLAEIVATWPRLPDAIKAGIIAMVKACSAQNSHRR